MDIYVFFENMNVLCIFAQPVFWRGLFPGFCPVPVPGIGLIDHQLGSDNIGDNDFVSSHPPSDSSLSMGETNYALWNKKLFSTQNFIFH